MVAPSSGAAAFSSLTPPLHDRVAIYLDRTARPSAPSRSSSFSSSTASSPELSDSAPHQYRPPRHHQYQHYPGRDSYEWYRHHQSLPAPRSHAHPLAGPLPLPHSLTLPPIDALTMSQVISPHPSVDATAPRVSMTSREWVIPPRPKPGRKPATDTPPTKRKAQNRAAQRAFRERRAARVGELEELLQQQKEEHDKENDEAKAKIRELEMEMQSHRSRCVLLETMLERERKERIRAETEAEGLRRRPQQTDMYSTTHSSHLTRRSFSSQQHTSRHDSLPHIVPSLETDDVSNPALTCGNCSPGSCACVTEALATVSNAFSQGELKRPVSPSGSISNGKRQRPDVVSEHQELQQPPSGDSSFKDDCGFCKDGTYCVCADAAMATPVMTPTVDILPPIVSQTQTPPPSEPDSNMGMAMEITSDGAVKLPRRAPASRAAPTRNSSRGCGPNGPGTCAQCQSDPKSGLFCRLMASKLGKEGGGDGGCCGGKGAGGGCCKSKAPEPEKITLPSLPSLGLTCAEAYQTLSSHRNFDRAADDIGSWLPKLRATPAGESLGPKRMMPMEVEAASIMSVLKDFDVRFGSAC